MVKLTVCRQQYGLINDLFPLILNQLMQQFQALTWPIQSRRTKFLKWTNSLALGDVDKSQVDDDSISVATILIRRRRRRRRPINTLSIDTSIDQKSPSRRKLLKNKWWRHLRTFINVWGERLICQTVRPMRWISRQTWSRRETRNRKD